MTDKKNNINIQKLLHYSSFGELINSVNPFGDSLTSSMYVVLNCSDMIKYSPDNMTATWDIKYPDNININNLVCIKAFPAFISWNYEYSDVCAPLIELYFKNLLGNSIFSLSSREHISSCYHFKYKMVTSADVPTPTNEKKEFIPLRDSFMLNEILTNIPVQLDINLTSLTERLAIPRQRFYIYGNDFSTTNPITIRLNFEHCFSNGDVVYITDFTTNNPSSDTSVINSINNPSGNSISIVDKRTFNINGNLTNKSIPNNRVSIYNPNIDFQFAFEFIYRS